MSEIKLLYFKGCPNVEKMRQNLRRAGISFDEICHEDLSPNDPLRKYSSPALLKGNQVIFGSLTEGGGCSLEIPSVEKLRNLLGAKKQSFLVGGMTSMASLLSSVISSATVAFCPLCIPAVGAVLSSLGLGFLVNDTVLKPLLILFLLLTIGGLLWSYLKEHRKVAPLILGIIFAIALYMSRYVPMNALLESFLMKGSIAGIILTSFWNLRLRKKASCSACKVS